MQTKRYILGKDFTPINSQHIDLRLVGKFCTSKLDKTLVAENITNILIYRDFLSNKYNSLIVGEGDIKPGIIYGSYGHISYQIEKAVILEIMTKVPLSRSLFDILTSDYHYKVDLNYKKQTPSVVWSKIFGNT